MGKRKSVTSYRQDLNSLLEELTQHNKVQVIGDEALIRWLAKASKHFNKVSHACQGFEKALQAHPEKAEADRTLLLNLE